MPLLRLVPFGRCDEHPHTPACTYIDLAVSFHSGATLAQRGSVTATELSIPLPDFCWIARNQLEVAFRLGKKCDDSIYFLLRQGLWDH